MISFAILIGTFAFNDHPLLVYKPWNLVLQCSEERVRKTNREDTQGHVWYTIFDKIEYYKWQDVALLLLRPHYKVGIAISKTNLKKEEIGCSLAIARWLHCSRPWTRIISCDHDKHNHMIIWWFETEYFLS